MIRRVALAGLGGAVLMALMAAAGAYLQYWGLLLIWLALSGLVFAVRRTPSAFSGSRSSTELKATPTPPSSSPRLDRRQPAVGAVAVTEAIVRSRVLFSEVPNREQALHFVYADAHGELTDRTVVNWIETDTTIEGVCILRRRKRTFRKDRVQEWLGGSERLLLEPLCL